MSIDPAAATAAYIATLGPDELAKAAAYTMGSHWLLLWGLVVSAVTSWAVVRSRLLERLSARLAGRGNFVRSFVICAIAFLLLALLSLPWTIYESWWRDSAYGRTSQPIADFLMQGGIAILLNMLLGGLFFAGVYALIRRTGRWWWAWSGGFAAFATTTLLLLSPILIEPLFNNYQPLPQGEVRTALETLADDAGIPHDRIFMFDGSRQSNNFTANVSGVFGSARIAISDVALGEAELDEVRAVTGHEIGHYVLGHVWNLVGLFALLAVAGFFLADRMYPWVARRLGSDTVIGDPVGLPVLMLLLSLLAMPAQPLLNTVVRSGEIAADNYSLAHVNLPDALATALVKTAEYRDPNPGRWQELLFYSHPSVSWRVRNAMNWKAAHPAPPPDTDGPNMRGPTQ